MILASLEAHYTNPVTLNILLERMKAAAKEEEIVKQLQNVCDESLAAPIPDKQAQQIIESCQQIMVDPTINPREKCWQFEEIIRSVPPGQDGSLLHCFLNKCKEILMSVFRKEKQDTVKQAPDSHPITNNPVREFKQRLDQAKVHEKPKEESTERLDEHDSRRPHSSS